MGKPQTLEEENETLRTAIRQLVPCAEAGETCLRADGLTEAADKCAAALDHARGLLGIPGPGDFCDRHNHGRDRAGFAPVGTWSPREK